MRQPWLAAYPWSGLWHFAQGEPPPWLEIKQVLEAFHLSHDRRGRAAYVAWLEPRAASHGGKIDEAAMPSLRKGWHLGEEGFKDKLPVMGDKVRAQLRKPGHHAGGAIAAHPQAGAGCAPPSGGKMHMTTCEHNIYQTPQFKF